MPQLWINNEPINLFEDAEIQFVFSWDVLSLEFNDRSFSYPFELPAEPHNTVALGFPDDVSRWEYVFTPQNATLEVGFSPVADGKFQLSDADSDRFTGSLFGDSGLIAEHGKTKIRELLRDVEVELPQFSVESYHDADSPVCFPITYCDGAIFNFWRGTSPASSSAHHPLWLMPWVKWYYIVELVLEALDFALDPNWLNEIPEGIQNLAFCTAESVQPKDYTFDQNPALINGWYPSGWLIPSQEQEFSAFEMRHFAVGSGNEYVVYPSESQFPSPPTQGIYAMSASTGKYYRWTGFPVSFWAESPEQVIGFVPYYTYGPYSSFELAPHVPDMTVEEFFAASRNMMGMHTDVTPLREVKFRFFRDELYKDDFKDWTAYASPNPRIKPYSVKQINPSLAFKLDNNDGEVKKNAASQPTYANEYADISELPFGAVGFTDVNYLVENQNLYLGKSATDAWFDYEPSGEITKKIETAFSPIPTREVPYVDIDCRLRWSVDTLWGGTTGNKFVALEPLDAWYRYLCIYNWNIQVDAFGGTLRMLDFLRIEILRDKTDETTGNTLYQAGTTSRVFFVSNQEATLYTLIDWEGDLDSVKIRIHFEAPGKVATLGYRPHVAESRLTERQEHPPRIGLYHGLAPTLDNPNEFYRLAASDNYLPRETTPNLPFSLRWNGEGEDTLKNYFWGDYLRIIQNAEVHTYKTQMPMHELVMQRPFDKIQIDYQRYLLLRHTVPVRQSGIGLGTLELVKFQAPLEECFVTFTVTTSEGEPEPCGTSYQPQFDYSDPYWHVNWVHNDISQGNFSNAWGNIPVNSSNQTLQLYAYYDFDEQHLDAWFEYNIRVFDGLGNFEDVTVTSGNFYREPQLGVNGGISGVMSVWVSFTLANAQYAEVSLNGNAPVQGGFQIICS